MIVNIRKRTSVIRYFIQKYNYKSYLEIGIANPKRNFNRIICDEKDGIDPEGNCNYKMTSDQFFKETNKTLED